MILFVDFHVYFWLLLSKRPHLKGSSAKKGTSIENFGGRGADAPFAAPPPLLERAWIPWLANLVKVTFKNNICHGINKSLCTVQIYAFFWWINQKKDTDICSNSSRYVFADRDNGCHPTGATPTAGKDL